MWSILILMGGIDIIGGITLHFLVVSWQNGKREGRFDSELRTNSIRYHRRSPTKPFCFQAGWRTNRTCHNKKFRLFHTFPAAFGILYEFESLPSAFFR
jgi:hypothetical protein